MTIQTFIEKAIEGGWKQPTYSFECEHCEGTIYDTITGLAFLDPEAWKAVGKVEGWEDIEKQHAKGGSPHQEDCWCACYTWKNYMHRMIDALAEGKTFEEYIATL